MRIRSLDVRGFGPFKEPQHVDFESFDDGLFLITGRTGAGKSSILDAICFALYGSAPRYEGTQPRLRSDFSEPSESTVVELVFTVDESDYRVIRSPGYDRAKKNGNGVTPQKATAELAILREGRWQGMAARPTDVAHELERIIGLTRDQFLQVILLAQNRFQDFLLAANDDRQRVLRSLFGTKRFEQFETALVERRKNLDGQLSALSSDLAVDAGRAADLLDVELPVDAESSPDLDWFENGFVTLSEQRAAVVAECERAQQLATRAEAAHRALEVTARAQVQRADARRRLAELELRRQSIDLGRAWTVDARRAESVWPRIVESVEAERSLVVAQNSERAARTSYAVVVGDESPEASVTSIDELRSTVDSVTRQLGTVEAALADELALPQVRQKVDRAREQAKTLGAELAACLARTVVLPDEIDESTRELTSLAALARTEPALTETIAALDLARDAAVQVEELEPRHREALAAELAASSADVLASTAVRDLLQRRLDGHAAELAAELVDDEPCAVCGSTAHPAPAEPLEGTDPVTDEVLEQARMLADVSRIRLDAARDTAAHLRTRLEHERVRTGGRSVSQVVEQLNTAHDERDRARVAIARIAKIESSRIALRAELAHGETLAAELRLRREAAQVESAEAEAQLTALTARVDQARADHESIVERVRALTRLLDAANTVMTAVRAVEAATSDATRASDALDTALDEHGFDTAEAAVSARRESADITAEEARIRRFDDELAVTTASLAEPVLDTVPEEPVQLDVSAEAMESAREALQAAMTRRNVLSSRVERLGGIVASVRTRFAASKKLLDQHRQLRELGGAIDGKDNEKRMRLETYVLAARLEEIVEAANVRLGTMTSGRYTLEHDDGLQYRNTQSGLGLLIRDEHSGRARATQSLSGGETFLASLALALGLAEVVTNQAGGIRLDTLFVDEGFGSLDSDTLDIAMSTLDSLRSGGRTIGLISHVDSMKDQIPAKLRITVNAHGWSEIEEAYEAA